MRNCVRPFLLFVFVVAAAPWAQCQSQQRSVFYTGADQHIYHFWGPPGVPWGVEDVTASAGGPVAAAGSPVVGFENLSYNFREIFFLGVNQHVYHYWAQPGVPWAVEDLTATTGAPPAAGPLTAFENDFWNFREVFYIGTDQHVYHFWGPPGASWGVEDLTGSTGAPLAAAGSALSGFENKTWGFREVFYVGTDQHVRHFWAAPGVSWGVEDLTASTGAPLVAAGSALNSFENSQWDFREVFYVGTDQHVYHFWAQPGVPWAVEDLTGPSGAPLAAVGSRLSGFENSLWDLRELFYLGTDQHVYHFWSTPGTPWGVEDVTWSTGAPLPAVNSALSGFENNLLDIRELFYLGTDQHVNHFWSVPGQPWGAEDLTNSTGAPPTAAGGALTGWAEAGLAPPSQSPTVQLTNLTHPDLSPNFEVGDTFQVTITGAPNQAVSLTQTPGGSGVMGYTDANGHFTITGVEQTSNIGSYTQVWSVGGTAITPAISFVIVQLGAGGMVSTTDIGQTSDGSVTGISTLSVANGTVSTYSVTELDYNASLYYNAQTVGTLYQDNTAIAQGVSPVSNGAAGGGLSAPAVAWATYDLQTDHYVVVPEIFFVDGYYQNTLYFGAGSCYEASSDCTIGLGGGIFWVEAASIYVGSTLADQTNIPQDGSMPPFSDALYDNFLASSEPPYPTGAVFKADVTEWRQRLLTVGLLAGGVAASVKSSSPPVPFLLELLAPPAGDEYVSKSAVIPPQGERWRTYVLRDSLGHLWPNVPVIVRERFSSKVGPGQLPEADGIWYNGPSLPGETALVNHYELTDHYALRDLSRLEVGFVQYYYAFGFTAPSWLQLPSGFSLPGTVAGTGAVPLWIKDAYNSCGSSFQEPMPAGQLVRLNANYTGIDGDNGPPPAQGCAPPL